MGLFRAIKPAVWYFLFHKNSSGKICAIFQCEDVHVSMDVCAQKMEGLQCTKTLPGFQGYFLTSGLI